jgi:hypothetical protein
LQPVGYANQSSRFTSELLLVLVEAWMEQPGDFACFGIDPGEVYLKLLQKQAKAKVDLRWLLGRV